MIEALSVRERLAAPQQMLPPPLLPGVTLHFSKTRTEGPQCQHGIYAKSPSASSKAFVYPRTRAFSILDVGKVVASDELLDAGYAHSSGYEVVDRLVLRNAADRDRFYIEPDGHIPVPDGTFDFVFSDQVLEHVMDQRAVITEIVRVLKPGGVSVHVFPSKWQRIEPHMKVPLGGLRPFKRFSWYFLWGALGIRNQYQHGLSAKAVAHRNYNFAQTKINYWSCREYQTPLQLLAHQLELGRAGVHPGEL